MGTFLRRVWHLVNRRRHERELVEEMQRASRPMHDPATFGDTYRLLERSRDAWGWNWLDDATQDLRLGVRTLVKSPSFAITATLILTFGIGLNVTLFQMIQVGLLRPPAMKHAGLLGPLSPRGADAANSRAVPYPLAQLVAHDNTALSAVLLETIDADALGARAEEQSMRRSCRRTGSTSSVTDPCTDACSRRRSTRAPTPIRRL